MKILQKNRHRARRISCSAADLHFWAPTNESTMDRGPEGRIDRIPPRPRPGRFVWVPGPYPVL